MGARKTFRESQASAWGREYAAKGALWRGTARVDFSVPSGASVLELGCGNGKTLSALANADCAITAIDISKKAVELCARMVHEQGLRCVRVMVADACALPFADASFDVVVAFHVLEHLLEADRTTAIREIRRVLKPGGRVFVRAFSVNDMRFGKGKEVEPATFRRKSGVVYHYFAEAELDGLFKAFRIKKRSLERRIVRHGGESHIREALLREIEGC